MTNGKPSVRAIVQINLRFLAAAFALFYGWLCWQWTSKQWWGFGPIAFICIIAGSCMMIAAIFKMAELVVRGRHINSYKREGGTPRADRMANDRDLKNRGLIR